MKVKKITVKGQIFRANSVHSPDEGGYYVEVWGGSGQPLPRDVQTSTFPTEAAAWADAREILQELVEVGYAG